MTKLSKLQAEILLGLLSYDEIRLRGDGYYFESTSKRANKQSLMGLIKRGLLIVSGTKTMPSAGLIAAPYFYDNAVTEKGREAFQEYVKSLPYSTRKEWLKSAQALEVEEKW